MKKLVHPEIKERYKHHMELYHPPLLPMPDIPVCLHYGAFEVRRKYDTHTGIDLYSPLNAPVYAIESGEIVAIRPFTGKHAGCEHWNETWEVCIEGYTGTFSYGEIKPKDHLKVGDMVNSGNVIGNILQVLKKDKGKAMSMLHFSLYSHYWKYLIEDQENPDKEHFFDGEQDPTLLLLQLKNKADIMMLSSSLSVNNVVFDGFSGFSDEEIRRKEIEEYQDYQVSCKCAETARDKYQMGGVLKKS